MALSARAALVVHKEHMRQTRRMYVAVQHAESIAKGRDDISRRAYEARLREEIKWEQWAQRELDKFHAAVMPNIDHAVQQAAASWTLSISKRLMRVIRKAVPPPNDPNAAGGSQSQGPSMNEIIQALQFGLDQGGLEAGAVQQYIGMAGNTGAVAGQSALEHMGLNQTFAWAHPRNMPQSLYEVRGSKVIQNMYGSHLNQLSQIIKDATNPTNPLTVQQVSQKIKAEWPGLEKYQVERIARTETAAVWSGTAANAYQANGITGVESTIAHGPSIGIESEDPCDECVDEASNVHSLTDDLPPWHPNCRCEIVPVLENEDGSVWLPPDEPWAGADLPMCGGPIAKARLAQRAKLGNMRYVRIKKEAGVPGACATPLPEPGDPFGGGSDEWLSASADEEDQAALDKLTSDINAMWTYQTTKDAAKKAIESVSEYQSGSADLTGAQMLVYRGNDGMPLSLAGGNKGDFTYTVTGVASKSGGARKLMLSIAKRASAEDLNLQVVADNISPQLSTYLESVGFKEQEINGVKYLRIGSNDLPDAFGFTKGDVVPTAPPVAAVHTVPTSVGAPQPEPPPEVAPHPGSVVQPATEAKVQPGMETTLPEGMDPIQTPGTVDEAKAQLYTARNKMSGLKTRLKKATAAGDQAKVTELNGKLQQLQNESEQLKAYIKSGGTSTTAGVVEVPVAPPVVDAAEATTHPPEEVKPTEVVEAQDPVKRAVVPGGLKKETGTTKLSKQISGGHSVSNKQSVADRIETELAHDDRWNPVVIKDAYGYGGRSYYADNPAKDTIASLVNNWARTSSDADWRGVALQTAIKDELGLHSEPFAASYWNNPEKAKEIADQVEAKFAEFPQLRDSLRSFVRAQYEATQKYLQQEGIDELTVYRGLAPKGEIPWPVGVSTMDVTDNPAASWGTRISVSKRGHFYGGTMLRASVPREMVLGTPLTGFGCSNEFEVVVLNDGRNKAWVVREGQAQLTDARRDYMEGQITQMEKVRSQTVSEFMSKFADIGAKESANVSGGADVTTDLAYGSREYAQFFGRAYRSEGGEYEQFQPDPRVTEYYSMKEQIQNARTYITSAQGTLNRGVEFFNWRTETQLKGAIQKVLDDNIALAGKDLRTKRQIAADAREASKQPQLQIEHPYAGDPELQYSADVTVGGDEAGGIQYVGGQGTEATFEGETKLFSHTNGTEATEHDDAVQWIKDQYEAKYGKITTTKTPKLDYESTDEPMVTPAIITENGDEVGKLQFKGFSTLQANYKDKVMLFDTQGSVAGDEQAIKDAKKWVKEQHDAEYGKKPSTAKGELTPEKRARNKVSSTKHALKELLDKQETAEAYSPGLGSALDEKVAAARKKYEDAQEALAELLGQANVAKHYEQLRTLRNRL